jgi:hypothetical protein
MSILFFSLFVFIHVATQDSTDRNRYLISITGNTTSPSPYLDALDIFVGGVAVDSSVVTKTISVDKNKGNIITIAKNNGDIGADLGVLSSVDFQGEGLSHEKFYLNYTLSRNRVYNSYMASTYDNNVNDYQVGCNLISNYFVVNMTTAWNSNITSVVTYSYASFGLIPGNLGAYYLSYKDGAVNVEPLSNLVSENEVNAKQYLSSILYSDIWVINQPYDNRILLVLKDKTQNNFYFFNIGLEARTPDEIKQGRKVKMSYYTDISLNQTETYIVNNIGIFKNDLLIGTDKGLYILRNAGNLGSRYQFHKLIVDPTKIIKSNSTNTNTTDSMNATDTSTSGDNIPSSQGSSTFNNKLVYLNGFSINELTVYAIFSGYGMAILDPNREYEINDWYFEHPYLISVDFINNPYLGNKYVGLAIKNQNQITEFFIELLVDNEFHPFLNKVYVSNEIISADNTPMVDLFYTYIFNKVNRQLIMIRRGLINAVSRESIVINVDSIMTLGIIYINPIISLYDVNRNKLIPAIPFKDQFYLFNDLTDVPNTLSCEFQRSGNYSVNYMSRTELCQPSISSKYIYSFCQKTIALQFFVIGGDTSDYDILVGVFVTVFGLILTGIIAWLLRRTQCCTNFKAFKIKKQQKINRVDLYIDQEPEKFTKHTPINDPLIIPKEIDKSDRQENFENYLAMGKVTKTTGFGGFELKSPETDKLVVETNAQMLRSNTTKRFKASYNPLVTTITPIVENIQVAKRESMDYNDYEGLNINNSPPKMLAQQEDEKKPMRGSYDYDAVDVDGLEKNLEITNENVKRRKKGKRKSLEQPSDAQEVMPANEQKKEVKKDDSYEY